MLGSQPNNGWQLSPPVIFLLTVPRRFFFRGSFFAIFVSRVSLLYCLVCSLQPWKRAGLFALLCVMFSCVFVSFLYGVSGHVWYLIVSIPDFCLLIYFCNFNEIETYYQTNPNSK